MARVDDYFNAKKIAAQDLANEKLTDIIIRSGFKLIDDNTIRIPFLNRVFVVSWPDFEFKDESEQTKEVPIQEQVIILHYLLAKAKITGYSNWISFREIPGASFYFSAFVNRAINPFKNTFGNNIDLFKKTSEKLQGKAFDAGDAAFEFMLFPNVFIQLILWYGDEEFPPEANILFNDNIGDILSPEDVAWLSGALVYRLVALAR